MPQSNDEVKAQLMRQAEELIDRLLSGKKPAANISLGEIDRQRLKPGCVLERLLPGS